VSRYDLFRRRIAPIAFLLAIALIARDTCQKDQRTHTAIELELGDARSEVRDVEVRVLVGSEIVNTFARHALPGSVIAPCRFDVALPGEDGTLEIDVTLDTAHRHLTRQFHAIEGSTMLVSVADDLKPRH